MNTTQRPEPASPLDPDSVDRVLDELRRTSTGRGLRWQILLTLCGVFLATVIIIGVAVTELVQSHSERGQFDNARVQTRLLAASLRSNADDDPAHRHATQERLARELASLPSVRRVEIVGPDGQRLIRLPHDDLPAERLAPIPHGDALQGRSTLFLRTPYPNAPRELIVAEPLCPPDAPPGCTGGSVALVYSTSAADARAAAGRNLVWLYLGLSALLMLAITYYLLTRLVIRPLRDIADGTAQLAAGDLNARVRVRSGNEVGQLAAEFNAMARRLRRQHDDLAARLRDLEAANHELALTQRSLIHSEKLATLGRLAAGLAHEVGNPLAALIGYIDLLRDGDLDPDEQRDLLTRTDRELHRIDATIRELLDYSRVGRTTLAPTPLQAPIDAALHLVAAQHRSHNITLTTDLPPDLPPALIDEGRLQQVLVNLLLNAADALQPQGGHVTLSARYTPDDHTHPLTLTLTDDGPGIPPHILPRIFEPFFTTKDPGAGTGLGLAICQSIIDSMGATLRAESPEGGGARFIIGLRCPPRSPPPP